MSANLESTAVATGLEKFSFHSNPKECSNCHTIVLISHASKIMLKILQARPQLYVDQNLLNIQAEFKKAEESDIKLPTSIESWIDQGNSRNISTSASFTMLKSLNMWITTKWKILHETGGPDHLTGLLRKLCASQEQQLQQDMEQKTGSNLGKEYDKAIYLTYIQSTSWKIPGCKNHKLDQDSWEK